MATAKLTIASVRKMARQKWGDTADIRHNPNSRLCRRFNALLRRSHHEVLRHRGDQRGRPRHTGQ